MRWAWVSGIIISKAISRYQLHRMSGFCSWRGVLCFCNYEPVGNVLHCWGPGGGATMFSAHLHSISIVYRLLNTARPFCQHVQVYFEEDRLFSWENCVALRGRNVDEEGFIFSFEESRRFLTQEKVENLGFPDLSGERSAGHVSSLPLPFISALSLAPNLSQ